MSCVFPRLGTATVLPWRSEGEAMPEPVRTTRDAPPWTAPETIRTSDPFSRSEAAGTGPMYAASMEPASMAWPAWLPETNEVTSTVVGARSRVKIPSAIPTRAGACVRLGNTPSRRTSPLPRARVAELEHAASMSASAVSATANRLISFPLRQRKRPRRGRVAASSRLVSQSATDPSGPRRVRQHIGSAEPKLLGHLDLHDLAVLDHEQDRPELELLQDLNDLHQDFPLFVGKLGQGIGHGLRRHRSLGP